MYDFPDEDLRSQQNAVDEDLIVVAVSLLLDVVVVRNADLEQNAVVHYFFLAAVASVVVRFDYEDSSDCNYVADSDCCSGCYQDDCRCSDQDVFVVAVVLPDYEDSSDCNYEADSDCCC